jgi:hypothetical protein
LHPPARRILSTTISVPPARRPAQVVFASARRKRFARATPGLVERTGPALPYETWSSKPNRPAQRTCRDRDYASSLPSATLPNHSSTLSNPPAALALP